MDYVDYKKLDVKKKLYELVSIQMKLKKNFVNIKSIENMDKYVAKYYIDELLNKAKQLRNDLAKMKNI